MDNYIALYYDFEYYHDWSQILIKQIDKSNPLYHIEILNLIKNLEDWFEESDFYSIIGDEGADGPFAAEMYRMIQLYCY